MVTRKFKFAKKYVLLLLSQTITMAYFNSIAGWSTVPEEKATKYRLTIKDIQIQDSGTYTCASPRGLTNSINIVVASKFANANL